MTNEVIWTKLVLERFIQLANLTEEEEIVIRTRAAGWSRVKQAMELNISISGIDRIISRLRKKYDEVQRLDPILPPRKPGQVSPAFSYKKLKSSTQTTTDSGRAVSMFSRCPKISTAEESAGGSTPENRHGKNPDGHWSV